MKKTLAALALGGASLFAANVQAALLNASFAGTVGGTISIPAGENLNNAASIDFDTNVYLVTSVPPNYLGDVNIFASESEYVFGGVGTIESLTIDGFTPIASFMTWTGASGAEYFFDLDTLVRNPTSAGAMDLFGTGQFGTSTPGSSPFDNVTTNQAAWRMTAQETGGNISASFSWGTPAFDNPAEVPEPAVLALFGAGLAGMGIATRRRRKTQVSA